MSEAERQRLEEELAEWRRQLEECRAQLAGLTEQGGTKYQKARTYWRRRIQQAREQITQIEAKLKLGRCWRLLRSMRSAFEVSVLFAAIGVVFWIGGGPHPRTRGAWLLLVAILIIAALPALLCWVFC